MRLHLMFLPPHNPFGGYGRQCQKLIVSECFLKDPLPSLDYVLAAIQMSPVLVLALVVAQAVFIGILLIERRKRIRTQMAIIRSIAEKQHSDNQLKQSKLFIERMAEAMPSVLFVYDLVERRNIYVNQRSSLVIGY